MVKKSAANINARENLIPRGFHVAKFLGPVPWPRYFRFRSIRGSRDPVVRPGYVTEAWEKAEQELGK